jgi:hypothetical protein
MSLGLESINRLRVNKDGRVEADRLIIGPINLGMLRKNRCIAQHHPYTIDKSH